MSAPHPSSTRIGRAAFWISDDAPIPRWLPDRLTDWFMDPLIDAAWWLFCRTHGHTPMVDMDNRTVYCAQCGRPFPNMTPEETRSHD